nr:epiplakin-like [Chelonoidis abingdonii]
MGPGRINAIAGVLVQSSKEKMSIYQAMMRGVLTPGTALVLLEAQAAIGFIIDPVKNKEVPVRDALSAGLTGGDYHEKLLSAERAVTGYTDPYTGGKISLFQAMKRDLIVKDHGIRLLEAQIATGGIIDPVHSHRLPVEVAYKRGYFDQELNRILSDPQNHSRSCFDPNTHENLTYMQLLSRCIPDPDTGLLMLQLIHKGSVLFQLDEKTRISLQSAPATVSVGLFQGQNVTVWELLYSRYVPDQKRQELLKKYKAGTLTIQEMTTIITTLINEAEQKSSREPGHVKSPSTQREMSHNTEAARSQRDEKREKALKTMTVDGPGGDFEGQKFSVWDLLFSNYVLEEKRQELLKKYKAGTLAIHEMITVITTIITEIEEKSRKLPTTRKTPSKETRTQPEKDKDAPSFEEQQTEKALKSTLVEVPAGEFHGRKVSVWDLLFSKYIPEEKRKELLQLHRAGILTTDQMKTIVTTIVSKTEEKSHHLPGHGESPSVETTTSEEAETPGSLCDKHLENALRSETVDVPVGEFKWQEVSLWELLFSSYISETKRQELLKKYRAGRLTIQEMITILTSSVTEAEGKSRKQEQQTEKALKSTLVEVPTREFRGRKVSVWDLLFSKYIPEEKRKELLQLHRAGILTTDQMKTIVTTIVSKTEEKSHHLPGHGESPSVETTTSEEAETPGSLCDKHLENALRSETVDVPVGEFKWQEVSLWELLFSSYVSETKRQELLKKYRAGRLTIQEMITILTSSVTEAEGKSRKLPTTKKTPCKETRMLSEKDKDAPSFEEQQTEKALKSTLVEVPTREFRGRKVSVWDLLFSKYIPEEKRKELLQLHRAGILTTDQMKTIVTTIVSKTEEKSHHLPGHGESPSVETTTSEEAETPGSLCDKHLENALRSETVDVPVGEFKWQEVSLWELLFSSYVSETKRQELLKKYRAGRLTIQEMITILTSSVTEAEGKSRKLPTTKKTPCKETRMLSEKDKDAPSFEEQQTEKALKSTLVEVPTREFRGRKVSVWDLLFSKYIPEEKRKELLQLHRAGILTTDQMKTIVTTIEVFLWELLFSSYISETKRQELLKKYRAGKLTIQEMIIILTTSVTEVEKVIWNLCINREVPSKVGVTLDKAEDGHSQEKHLRKSLKHVTIYVNTGEIQGQNVSLLDLLFSKYFPQEKRQELLALYRARVLTIEQMIPIITSIITTTEDTSRQFVTSVKSPNREEITSLEAVVAHSPQDIQLDNILKATTIDGPVSEFQGQKVSMWDLLFSNYIPEEKRQELLELHRVGILTTDQVITVVTILIRKKEDTSRKFVINVKTPSKDTMTLEKAEDVDLHEEKKLEKALKSTMVDVLAGEFHEQKVSVWDLLFFNYIPEEKRQGLLELYRARILTMDQVITVVTSIVTKIGTTRRKLETNVHSPSAERAPSQEADAAYSERNENQEMALKSTIVGPVGEFQGPKVSVWDLLFSKYVPKETRQELLEKHRAGTLTTKKMITSLTSIVSHALEEDLFPDNQQILNLLQSEASYVTVGWFQDPRVSVWELLSSKCVSQYNREVHLDTYNAGRLAVNEITITTTIIANFGRKPMIAGCPGTLALQIIYEHVE